MFIQCTKALLDKINVKDELKSPEGYEKLPNSLKAWHANIITIDRKKAMVLMNNETRYIGVIYGLKSNDFSRIKELIKKAIITALHMEGIGEEVIKKYMIDAGEIEFSKTANRSMVAKMNKAVNEVQFMEEYIDKNTKIQKYIGIVTGRLIQQSSADEGFYPIEKLTECLGIYCDNEKEVLDIKMYQLKVKINMDGFDIWRRVLVPSTYSFRHLHNVIQIVFDWQNYHLHVFEAKGKNSKIKQIVMDDEPETLEWLDFDRYDILQERFTAVEDIFANCDEVTYEYDFGDSWEHTIILEKVTKSNEFKAVYLEGSGERPPEDVGGSWGYQEYMRIMQDETDSEHDDMKAWAESQKERKFSPETIDHRLRRSIQGYRYSYY